MGGFSSTSMRGVDGQRHYCQYGDWVRYEAFEEPPRDLTFIEVSDDGDIWLRDEHARCCHRETVQVMDYDRDRVLFVCHKDDERFFLGNSI